MNAAECIVITGGSGFLGSHLARRLLQQSQQQSEQIPGQSAANASKIGLSDLSSRRLVLLDRMPPPSDLARHPQVSFVVGDVVDLLAAPAEQPALPADTTAIVHLAAAVSAECEADFDLGMRSNVQATTALLDAARRLGTQPVFVYASSLAVFGFGAGLPTPEVIDDFSLPTPQGSYGIQKFIGEQLVADYGRKGFVRARSVRPMTVSVRPGKPNGAASGFLSGMIREPLAGVAANVPVSPDLQVALASPSNTVSGLACALHASDAEWGPRTAMNLPSIRVSVGEMAVALKRVGGVSAHGLLTWQRDPAVERLVSSWPAQLRFDRAASLGLVANESFDAIVAEHLAWMAERPQA